MWLFSACTGTKHLPEGKTLYNGAEVEIGTPKTINGDKKVARALESQSVPQPNRKFLGLFRIRLWLNNKVKEPKRDKGLRHWLKYKIGEEPVYANESQFEQSNLRMEQYLQNHGYFTSNVTYETKEKKRQETAVYTVTSRGQYFINEIHMPRDSGEISHIVRENENELDVKSGQPYNVERLGAERDKFATFIRSEGYYDFSKEYIYYFVDTTVENLELDIYFRVKPPSDTTGHKKYYINNITVYPFYSLDDSTAPDANDTVFQEEYRIIHPEVFLRPKTIARNILIETGHLFSQKKHNYTINHFLDLGIFKFVNIRYEKVGNDSLDVVLHLTPSNTQDVAGELNVSTTTSNFLGWGVSGSYTNRNLFKGGERLIISGSMNTETQLNTDQSFINTLEINSRIELGFPRLLVPFGNKKVNTYYIPRTKFALSESFQKRIEYYTINSFKFDFAYDWRKGERIRHIVTPHSVNDIRLLNTTSKFDEILDRNPNLRTSFDNVFIVSLKYSFIYTGRGANTNESYGYFRGNADLAGNVIYLIARAAASGSEPYQLFGRPFANYSGFDIDGRYYFKLNKMHSLATRVIMGIIIPYGNSEVTPYLKQFFIGGATSVRAYRLRTLGPGGFADPDADEDDVFPDQTGDIKLEMNLEYRFTIVKFLKGALFTDVGNVWLLRKDPQKPQAEFDVKRFHKEIAIGVGAGIRLDFDFFVIRLDVSFPLRKPELPEGDRWTFDKLKFREKEWRQDNLIWNIAIGYPF